MKLLVEALPSAPKSKGDVLEVLIDHEIVTQSRWERINSAEVAKGEPLGKPRVKAVDKQELLRLGGL
ncbi:MAG: hypothetical protein HY050_10105 [Actinobacteria bacterium]|nr:hypothetical protein [Actinomycetota bacterium]